MTALEVHQIIISDLDNKCIQSMHGIQMENIKEFLIFPNIKKYVIAINRKIEKFWLVFDESPEDEIKGYQIVFDEEENLFGLASKTNKIIENTSIGVVLGLYGSFVEALNNM